MCKSYDILSKLFCSTVMYVCHSEASTCSLSAMASMFARSMFARSMFCVPFMQSLWCMVMQPRFFLLIADLVTLIDEDCLQTAVRCAQDVCLAVFGIRQILLAVLLVLFMHVPN